MTDTPNTNDLVTPASLPFTEELIDVDEMIVDPLVQRSRLNRKKVQHIIDHFNPTALDRLTISRRAEGANVLLDGWHRQTAVKELKTMGRHDGKTPSRVFVNLTRRQEAIQFVDCNTKTAPTRIDLFNVLVQGEDPEAIAIHAMLKRNGWHVAAPRTNGNIQCISVLEDIYRRSLEINAEPNLLQVTLMLVSNSWGDVPDAVRAPLLLGLASFLEEHGDRLDFQAFKDRLRDYTGGAHALVHRAYTLAATKGTSRATGVAELLTEVYNKGRGTRALPPWRRQTTAA